MRVPLSWLREYVDLPAEVTGRDVAERIIRAGLEVETVERVGELRGPLVVGKVVAYEELTEFKKPIRYCQVDVGEDVPRGIVCGAINFGAGDNVVVALPGAELPGGFAIGARTAYGRISDGMICSESELGMSAAKSSGILVLPPDAEVGADAVQLLGLRDEVLDIAVTPDRGYCFSVRGVAREVATAYDISFHDPGLRETPDAPAGGHPVQIEDETGCDRFVARTVTGIDPSRPSPLWLQRRLQMAGMRPLSLAVDITNYVMLELGQPLHGYDRALLQGPIVVRRAAPGEKVETLDGATRDLDTEDLLITDGSGPIGLAGVMGGATTEISASTTDVVIEAAHFDPVTIARTSRRHRLSSEASRRFERGVDHELPAAAAARAADLLVELAAGTAAEGVTVAGPGLESATIRVAASYPARVAGREISAGSVVRRLEQIGCTVGQEGDALTVHAPSWRPDITDPADVAEEVIRLEGYDSVPSTLPLAPAGRGLTAAQRLRRRVGQALAAAGYVETLSYPFIGVPDLDALGIGPEDPRRRLLRLANPLSDEEPELRTTLLPGLLATLRRNVRRGTADVAVFESGAVYLARPGAPGAPRLPVDRRPSDDEVARVQAALPDQPRHVGVALCGQREPGGWWGRARAVSWAEAVEAGRVVARAAGVQVDVRAAPTPPWHPGRCAELVVDGRVVGHAGELHPRVVAALGLPARTCAMELDLDLIAAVSVDVVAAPSISSYPVATQDVALVVDADVPVADVEAALRAGAGELLESLRLFDVFTGEQIGAGRKSLAFALRFRAADRTLTVEEASAARDAAVEEAARRTGAVLRGA